MTPAAVAERPIINVQCNDWEEPLYHPKRYKVLYGGRSSGKTWAVAKALVIQAMQEYHVIYCVREHLNSLRDSAKAAIEGWIHRLGVAEYFHITNNEITCFSTGSYFRFHGLSVVSEEDIKGWEGVTRCWAEEAHTMSKRSRELLYPTVFRQANSEFWATFNPKNRYDPVYEDFVSGTWGQSSRYVKKVNYTDNPHMPAAEEELRQEYERLNPLQYPHVWLGEPDDAGAEKKVLPYVLLQKCVNAWDRKPTRGVFRTGGFDVADTGEDYNALILRSGPELFYAERWHGSDSYTISHSSRYAAKTAVDNGVTDMTYDMGGVGRGVRGPIREWIIDNDAQLVANGAEMGGTVQAGGIIFEQQRPKSVTNDKYFRNWGAQAAMCLVIRAQNTERLLSGGKIDPGRCLFINPEIPELTDMLADMARPEWTDETGKYRIDKQPRAAGAPLPPSPDFFDGARLGFSRDARRGLPGNLK